MLTVDQRKAIFVAVKSSYTIEGKSFTVGHQYSNQLLNTYPRILINYVTEESKRQNAIGNFIGLDGYNGQRNIVTISFNIYAKAAQGLSAYIIAQEIARQFSLDIRENWVSLSNDTMKFIEKSETRDLTGLESSESDIPGELARYQFDVKMSYDISW
jgi:hypothetical protein